MNKFNLNESNLYKYQTSSKFIFESKYLFDSIKSSYFNNLNVKQFGSNNTPIIVN